MFANRLSKQRSLNKPNERRKSVFYCLQLILFFSALSRSVAIRLSAACQLLQTAQEQDTQFLYKEIQKANVICIVYSVEDELTIEKVRLPNGLDLAARFMLAGIDSI